MNGSTFLLTAIGKKDAEIRQKQREIDRLYGKLAAASPLTDLELRSALEEAHKRLKLVEGSDINAEQ